MAPLFLIHEIRCTPGHPFWVAERADYVSADELLPGDTLAGPDGERLTFLVAEPEDLPHAISVYNFEVAEAHTYFVTSVTDTAPILVHNGPKCSRGGSYDKVRGGNVGGEVHHMPAARVTPYPYRKAPAAWMTKKDHRLTASWGNSAEARAYRAKQAALIAEGKLREAIQMDIDDVRSKFGSKYDDYIREMLQAFGFSE